MKEDRKTWKVGERERKRGERIPGFYYASNFLHSPAFLPHRIHRDIKSGSKYPGKREERVEIKEEAIEKLSKNRIGAMTRCEGGPPFPPVESSSVPATRWMQRRACTALEQS